MIWNLEKTFMHLGYENIGLKAFNIDRNIKKAARGLQERMEHNFGACVCLGRRGDRRSNLSGGCQA